MDSTPFSSARWPIFLLLTIPPTLLDATTPFRVPYETKKTFGYDGPWNAVKVSVGTPPQPLHLFPAGHWGTVLQNTTVCDEFPDFCPAKDEMYRPENSKSRNKHPGHNFQEGYDGTAYGRTTNEIHLFDTMTVGEGADVFKLEPASLH